MKLLALPSWYRSFTIQTVRWRLYQVAGVVVRHAHQLLLKIVAPINKIVLFCKFRLRCREIAYTWLHSFNYRFSGVEQRGNFFF
jgi:hypothetical protein